jgi:hypothetical protein
MAPAAVPAVVRTVPVPAPSPAIRILGDYDEGVPAALLFFLYLFGGKALEVLLGERLDLLHVLVETLIVDAILEALYGAVLA